MPPNPKLVTKLELLALAVGIALIGWWTSIEHQWLIPRPLPKTRAPLSFHTGDLLFFRGLSWVEKTIQTYTRCRYNHVSMVVEESGKYFLWEADVGEGYRKGPRMIPLETKLVKWRGTSELAYRPARKSLERDRILSFAQTKTSANFDTSMMKWLLEKWPRDGEKYFCSELVALTLQEVGVLSREKRSSSYSPKDLAFGKLDSHFKTILLRE